MRELLSALPDDRPVTSLCVVEEVSKCPAGFIVVAKTYDQDLDADLWKDGFFGKRITRYLCLSKSEGQEHLVVDSICVLNEKDTVPNGYTLLAKTRGTDQKAWRKRQLCYRLSDRNSVFLAVTDVIILSKTKNAPDGFTLAGEMNGMLICYKTAPVPPLNRPAAITSSPASLPYCNSPITRPSRQGSNSSLNTTGVTPVQKGPVRPAPLPPAPTSPSGPVFKGQITSAGTLSGFTGLEGVPFTLSPVIQATTNPKSRTTEALVIKSAHDIFSTYSYSFSVEREVTQRPF